jgi:hypothetical protein
MPSLRLLLLLPLCALAAACGGTTSDSACADIAAVRCNQRATCSNGTGITRVYGDQTTCLAREKLSCTNALAAKNSGNTPDRVEQCAAALKAESCADYFALVTPAACINTGTLSDGTACAFAGQCSSTYCTNDANAACGVCGQPVAANGDCTNGGTCARGATCATTPGSMGMMMSCITPAAAGASCSRVAPCGTGLTCVGAIGMGPNAMPGSCMASGTMAGVACDPTARTAPGCDRAVGLFCNTTSKTCTAVTYAANGATCGVGSDGNLTDCAGGTCFGTTCKAAAADGAACDTVNGPDCLAPAKCATAAGATTGTCTLADASKC